ncbi:acyl transferase/acyl hydrolase/lysophospholipase [Thelonectria olida]|uniref:Lysophospholipase n=1 Tax=Thelonectria olida TaxID=1576542 RepID=A0A9P8W0R0_9HYPO|nr:acyl transferase/acyl hydrolase/lysophospholipase [Thelonectria olida]
MHRIRSPQLLSLALLALNAIPARGQGQDPYAPTYTKCPSDLRVRDANDGLSKVERTWRESRSEQIIPALRDYLELANISGFDVSDFIEQLNTSNVPVVGLSVSGGGSQSGMGGLGVWQAFDARYQPARQARTGGLTQLLSYITGLSGGGAITVSVIASTNFTSVDEIRKAINFSVPYDEGPSGDTDKFFNGIFENAGAKAEAGFPVSVADIFGQFWGNWLPEGQVYSDYSDIALPGGVFAQGGGPMPIVTLAEVVPGESPEIGKIMYPGNNKTNGFNLTSYEVTPFEFGSWLGGRVQAFIATEWLGTAMSDGKVQNKSECVQGFDKFTLVQGSTADAFCAYWVDAFYDIPIFAKRGLEARQQSPDDANDIPIPPGQEQSPLVQLVNETASNFDMTLNESLWATYPNPFMNYNDAMEGISELLLVDGSLTGETNPLRPLIIPARQLDFIVVYEASSDAPNSWVNGTNLINTALSASEGNIPFPDIPTVDTMVTLNLTRQPTFFGCDAAEGTPLVLYLPNSPWSGYTNFSYMKTSFTNNELDLTLENAFQLATYGNGTVDENWPACLACAAIKGSLKRVEIDMPRQCKECFEKHCWGGKESTEKATAADFDLSLRLNPSLTYQEWNGTQQTPERLCGISGQGGASSSTHLLRCNDGS